jgi:16S rRNA (cytosine967-C5)-methyltransferase
LAIALVKSNSVSPARLAAFEILNRVAGDAYSSTLLATKEAELGPLDRALTHELVMGVLRRQLWLDTLIEHYSQRKIANLDVPVVVALRLGLYQLRFLSRIPASAAVNESVTLVRRARLRSAEGFVNAVLRRAAREPEFDPAAEIEDPIERLAVTTSHPRWLLERWIKNLGLAEAEKFARANNQPAPTAFRIVQTKANEEAVIEELRAADGIPTPSSIARDAWLIKGATDSVRQRARGGDIYIQDEASQLLAEILAAKSGERILDLCAGPGSKTTQIADQAGDKALVVAGDLHDSRIRLVDRAVKTQQLKSVACVMLDGLKPLPFPESSFDRVLIDAPCSGTGTLRRNPEIRWRISAADISELSDKQNKLLENASSLVKPGGRLVYSTCSVEPEENEDVVSAFVKRDSRFVFSKLVDSPLSAGAGTLRTWPQRDGADGFFIAAFERKS